MHSSNLVHFKLTKIQDRKNVKTRDCNLLISRMESVWNMSCWKHFVTLLISVGRKIYNLEFLFLLHKMSSNSKIVFWYLHKILWASQMNNQRNKCIANSCFVMKRHCLYMKSLLMQMTVLKFSTNEKSKSDLFWFLQ